MHPGLAVFVDRLGTTAHADEAWHLVLDYFAGNGAEWVHYVYAPPPWQVAPGRILRRTNLPADWSRHYRESRYDRHDPATAHCARYSTPMLCGPGLDQVNYSREARRMYAESAEWGAGGSIAFPLHSLLGSPVGAMVCITRMRPDEFRLWWRSQHSQLHLAALAADAQLVQLMRPAPDPGPELSGRERECLLLLASGLRTDRIAHRLCISNTAVDLYFANARRKLGARTRDQALLKAMMLGKLVP